MSVIGTSYLRGAHGYILVADGTRQSTLDSALALKKEVDNFLNNPPFVGLINKADLEKDWEISPDFLSAHTQWAKSSALTGEGVEKAFEQLATLMNPI